MRRTRRRAGISRTCSETLANPRAVWPDPGGGRRSIPPGRVRVRPPRLLAVPRKQVRGGPGWSGPRCPAASRSFARSPPATTSASISVVARRHREEMRVATFARRLVAAEVDAICKAGDRDVTRPARELRWRGARGSDTHAGTTGLAIPNLHHDSYHPGRLLEPREHAAGGARRSGRRVRPAGGSTRRVEGFVQVQVQVQLSASSTCPDPLPNVARIPDPRGPHRCSAYDAEACSTCNLTVKHDPVLCRMRSPDAVARTWKR